MFLQIDEKSEIDEQNEDVVLLAKTASEVTAKRHKVHEVEGGEEAVRDHVSESKVELISIEGEDVVQSPFNRMEKSGVTTDDLKVV